MDQLVHVAIWVVGLFGGAKMVESTLENFLMNQPWMPQAAKKYVVPIGTLIGGVVAAIYGGMAPADAFMAAITVGGGVAAIHDHPAFTASELPGNPDGPAAPIVNP